MKYKEIYYIERSNGDIVEGEADLARGPAVSLRDGCIVLEVDWVTQVFPTHQVNYASWTTVEVEDE